MMDDLISRQAVITTLCERRCGNKPKGCPSGFCTESLAVDCIPSAQPKIIRCKDCKYVSYEPCKDYENVYVCNRTTFTRMNGGNVSDAFCSYAERRTDG